MPAGAAENCTAALTHQQPHQHQGPTTRHQQAKEPGAQGLSKSNATRGKELQRGMVDRLLGGETELLSNESEEPISASSVRADVIGLYFTARWCPPCRKFTPVAKAAYERAKRGAKSFEVVQISCDSASAVFDEYRRTTPWLSLPYDQRDLKERLCKKYRVSGMPMMVFLDGRTGKLITREGRSAITDDPEGFLDVSPPPAISAIGDILVRGDGMEVQAAGLKGKYTALYFSASWCKPSEVFTSKLREAYKKIGERRDDFEIVEISLDQDQKRFDEHAGAMPWLSVPFETARARGSDLANEFGVEEIPHLVMLSPSGNVINKDIVALVAESIDSFPFQRKPVRDIAEAGGNLLNKTPALIVFGDADGALDAPAQEEQELVEAHEDEHMIFCSAAACAEGSLGWKVRKLCGLGEVVGQAEMVLLDIPHGGGYYLHEGAVTEQSVREFVRAYHAGELALKQLGPISESG